MEVEGSSPRGIALLTERLIVERGILNMRDQTNAIVDCDVARLNAPLRTWFARAGHNFVARFRRIPADVTGVFVRIFQEGDTYFDVDAIFHFSGEWSVSLSASTFPAAGTFRYEVHATASNDEPCALGEGRIEVQPFSTAAKSE
jgi:hypothetical protein